MLLRIVAIIFPIFAIVAVGYAYARVKKPDMTFANQLNMDLFVPALVFAAARTQCRDRSRSSGRAWPRIRRRGG